MVDRLAPRGAVNYRAGGERVLVQRDEIVRGPNGTPHSLRRVSALAVRPKERPNYRVIETRVGGYKQDAEQDVATDGVVSENQILLSGAEQRDRSIGIGQQPLPGEHVLPDVAGQGDVLPRGYTMGNNWNLGLIGPGMYVAEVDLETPGGPEHVVINVSTGVVNRKPLGPQATGPSVGNEA